MQAGELRRIGTAVRDSYSTPAAVDKYRSRAGEGLRTWEAAVVRQHLPANGVVLVLGCGAGREAFALEERGYSVTGADVASALMEVARALARERDSAVRFELVDGHTLPFGEATFDAVTLWSQLLGNVPGATGRLSLLREARRVLRRGGVLSLSAHDRGRTMPLVQADALVSTDEPEPGDLYLREEDESTTRYWHYFSPDELRDLCARAGFDGPLVVHTSDLGQQWDSVLVAVCVK